MKLFQTIANATLMPLEGTISTFSSGVFDSAGSFIEGSMLDRNETPATPVAPDQRLEGTYLFGGYLFGHYGHFLLESLSRVYAFKQCKAEFPIVFMTTRERVDVKYKNIFSILGVNNELVLIQKPTQVERLLFSTPGCGLNPPHITPAQLEALGAVSTAPCENKVWLSRSNLQLLGGITNEKELEGAIAKLGYTIVHPELLSSLEQIRLIASSSIVAGFDGSAFFTSLLAKKVHGHFCMFSRRNSKPEAITALLTAKQLSFELHIFNVDYVSGQGPLQRFHLSDTQPLLDVLAKL